MTISKKMSLLVFAALIGIVSLAGVSLYQMLRMFEAANFANANTVPSLELINQVQSNFLDVRIRINRHVLSTDASEMQKIEERLTKHRHEVIEGIKKYLSSNGCKGAPCVSDDRDKGYFEEIQRLYTEYDSKIEPILAESRNGEVGMLKARGMLDKLQELANKIESVIGNALDYNIELADKAETVAKAVKGSAITACIAIGLVTFSAIAVLGYSITRSIVTPVAQAMNAANTMAKGDMTVKIESDSQDEVGQLMSSMKSMCDQLRSTVHSIQEIAARVLSSANDLSQSSGQMASSAGQQSEAASAMAAAVEETTVSINHITDNANAALQVSQQAGDMSREGGEIIGKAVAEMNGIAVLVGEASQTVAALGQQSQQISAIVHVIKEVADQTNLLALNAAIEAARAGEQGRGFAVVADEVRKLAERTTQSTQEIGAMIEKIQGSTEEAVQRMDAVVEKVSSGQELANEAGKRMETIQHGAEQVVTAVNEISSSLREQSAASHDVAQNVERVAQMTEENSSVASQVTSSAHELRDMANSMQAVVSKFRT